MKKSLGFILSSLIMWGFSQFAFADNVQAIQPQAILPTTLTPQSIYLTNVTPQTITLNSVTPLRVSPTDTSPEFITLTLTTPQLHTPTFITPNVIGSGLSLSMMSHLRFDDLYIPNPDNNPEAADYAALSKKDYARLGISLPSTPPLEQELLARTHKSNATIEIATKPLPVTLYTIDTSHSQQN